MPTPPPQPVAASAPVALTAEQDRARRLAAAQRLAGNRVSASRLAATQAAAPRIAAPTAEAARAATETLKVRYQDSVDAARKASIKRLVDGADEAIAKEDFVTAANQLRVALTHAEEPELRAKYESVNLRAREILADTYLKQGAYEESQDKWREAGATYAKAAEARPGDGNIAAKAANAMRRDGRDLHAAARFGEVAVQKNPASAEFRVTLGLVYFDAGLLLRAKSELEQAVRLAPEDAKAKELLARVKSAIG
jgi:tetratricopeptide (TPR) repeat protein